MDYFEVMGKEAQVLGESHLVNELQAQTEEMDKIPVVFREKVCYCTGISGGSLDDGTHVLELEGFDGNLTEEHYYMDYEVHTNEKAYLIQVTDHSYMHDKDKQKTLFSTVERYVESPMTFADGLLEAVDGRETSFDPDNE